MQWIDHILNLAAWILWINGSMGLMQPWKPQSGISSWEHSRRFSPSRMNPAWFFILGVALILCFKILLLHYLGKPLASTVAVDFLLFPVFFKTGSLSHMALMGVVTFIRFSFMGYLWLWFLRCLTTGKGWIPCTACSMPSWDHSDNGKPGCRGSFVVAWSDALDTAWCVVGSIGNPSGSRRVQLALAGNFDLLGSVDVSSVADLRYARPLPCAQLCLPRRMGRLGLAGPRGGAPMAYKAAETSLEAH